MKCFFPAVNLPQSWPPRHSAERPCNVHAAECQQQRCRCGCRERSAFFIVHPFYADCIVSNCRCFFCSRLINSSELSSQWALISENRGPSNRFRNELRFSFSPWSEEIPVLLKNEHTVGRAGKKNALQRARSSDRLKTQDRKRDQRRPYPLKCQTKKKKHQIVLQPVEASFSNCFRNASPLRPSGSNPSFVRSVQRLLQIHKAKEN